MTDKEQRFKYPFWFAGHYSDKHQCSSAIGLKPKSVKWTYSKEFRFEYGTDDDGEPLPVLMRYLVGGGYVFNTRTKAMAIWSKNRSREWRWRLLDEALSVFLMYDGVTDRQETN